MSKCASVNFFRLDYYLVEIPQTFRHAKIVYQVIGTSSSDLRQSICRNVKRLIGLRWPIRSPLPRGGPGRGGPREAAAVGKNECVGFVHAPRVCVLCCVPLPSALVPGFATYCARGTWREVSSVPFYAGADKMGSQKSRHETGGAPGSLPVSSPARAAMTTCAPVISKRRAAAYGHEINSLTSFLSESRLEMEASHHICSSAGCAYVQTGLAAAHCCRVCSSTPGSHGPHCERRMLRCRASDCIFAVTGIAGCPGHCCRLCARGAGHGPLCQRVQAVGFVEQDEDEGEGEEGEWAGEGWSEDELALQAQIAANDEQLSAGEAHIAQLLEQLELQRLEQEGRA